jgi:hypothetical protein|tara:strand:+ start:1829 stop:1990 length:162 start_codon:yes stop_codon:yes gene_type:complete
MPYKRVGKTVYVKKGGKWKKKSTTKSVASANRMLRLLRGVKHGWKPTGRRAKR